MDNIVWLIFSQFLLTTDKNWFWFSSQFSRAVWRGSPVGSSLFNRLGLRGVLHKAGESTVCVGVSGVSAKFSKSSQCVSQWQHMLESLQGKSRMHTCERTHRHRLYILKHLTGFGTCRHISAFEMHLNKIIKKKCITFKSVVLQRTGAFKKNGNWMLN